MRDWRRLLRAPRRPAGHSEPVASRDAARIAELEKRLCEAEQSLESAKRSIAALEIGLAAAIRRANAHVDLTEQRMDLIYRRVTEHLSCALSGTTIISETEAAIDARLVNLLSSGLEAKIDPSALAMNVIVSDHFRPGLLQPPLTLYGFRIDRRLARERGDGIEILALGDDSHGIALYGPYKRLIPGSYRVSLAIAPASRSLSSAVTGELAVDVFSPGSERVLGSRSLDAKSLTDPREIAIEFLWTSEDASEVVEFRLHQRSSVAALVSSVRLEMI